MPLMIALALAAAPASAEPPAEVQKLLQDCSAHRFETSINVIHDGAPHQSKVKLCGKPGQSDAQWLGTLRDTVTKVTADPRMPPAAKQQIVDAVKLEIVRLGASPAAVPAPGPVAAPAMVDAPPLPEPRRAPSVAQHEYSALPAFPPPVAFAPAGALGSPVAVAAVAYAPPLPRPKLSFTCYSAGDIAVDGPCFAFDRDTMLTVRAGEPLKNTLLRFVRDGNARADFALPPLAKGKSVRFSLPREVCAHAVGGKLSISIVRGPAGKPEAAQVVGTEGPFNLRC